jgi:hypothetical protein
MLEFLRLIMTVQIQEEESARQLGIKPSFTTPMLISKAAKDLAILWRKRLVRDVYTLGLCTGSPGIDKAFLVLNFYSQAGSLPISLLKASLNEAIGAFLVSRTYEGQRVRHRLPL